MGVKWKPQDKFLPWLLWSFFSDNLGFDFHVTHAHTHISVNLWSPAVTSDLSN